MHQLLRDLLVAAAAVGALLGHRATFAFGLPLRRGPLVEPQTGEAAATHQTLEVRLSGFAGRGFAANVAVAIAHACHPLIRRYADNALLPTKVAGARDGSADRASRFMISPSLTIRLFSKLRRPNAQ